jgi:peptide methionine sulfoxide reductase MsrA
MQLAHAMLNTNKTIKNKPKSPKQIKAEAEHQAWLKKNGVHLDQLKKQKTGKLQTTYKSDNIKTSDIIVGS